MKAFTSFVKDSEIDKISNKENGIPQLFVLFLKTVYSTTIGKVVIIFSPMLVALALSMMFPIYISVGAAQVFVTALSSGVIWGMTYFSIRRTTFYNNLYATKISVFKVYVSIWLVMLFVTFWSETTYWLTTMVLDQLNVSSLIGNVFDFGQNEYDINWLSVDWFTLVYTWLGSVTLMFVACFATRQLFKTEQLFFLVLLVYILVLIPFGGIIPPGPNRFNYNGEFIELNKNLNFVGYISMLFPQYHLNLFNYVAIWSGTNIVDATTGVSQGSLGNMGWLSSFKWSTEWQWDFTIIYPLACGFVILIIDIWTLDLSNK